MPATSASSALDTTVSKLKASADSCAYGLTDRRLKPLRTAMEQHPLCLLALPAIMELPNKVLGNDSKQKYMRWRRRADGESWFTPLSLSSPVSFAPVRALSMSLARRRDRSPAALRGKEYYSRQGGERFDRG